MLTTDDGLIHGIAHHTVVCSNYSVKHACSYVLCIAIVLHSTIEPMSHVWYELGAGKVRN